MLFASVCLLVSGSNTQRISRGHKKTPTPANTTLQIITACAVSRNSCTCSTRLQQTVTLRVLLRSQRNLLLDSRVLAPQMRILHHTWVFLLVWVREFAWVGWGICLLIGGTLLMSARNLLSSARNLLGQLGAQVSVGSFSLAVGSGHPGFAPEIQAPGGPLVSGV